MNSYYYELLSNELLCIIENQLLISNNNDTISVVVQ